MEKRIPPPPDANWGVGTVVTGHFLRQDKLVRVTLEAVSIKDNKLIWTGTVTAPADNLIALQNQLARKVKQELVPALGVANAALETSSAPANRDGYDLYLRTLSISHDGAPNKEAITMLERAVALDPNYAPAWEVLGRRYYFDAIYSGGGASGISAFECRVPKGTLARAGTGGRSRISSGQ